MISTELFFAGRFLQEVRELVKSQNLKTERLPKWVSSAHVEIGKLNNSNIFVFEDSTDKDEILFLGEFCSDLQFFLRLPEYLVSGAGLPFPRKPLPKDARLGMLDIIGEYGQNGQAVLNIRKRTMALFLVGYVPYHMPISLTNVMIQLKPTDSVDAIRFVPFALYIHDKDFVDFDKFWKKACADMSDTLQILHNSTAGDYYERLAERRRTFLFSKERAVIVFGKYGEEEIKELCQVRDYLSKNYDAHLLIELPEHPSMSLEEKVRLWASASRFCVMVDRAPSGHLVEYPYLKSSLTVLALLRPMQKGSTAMIENEATNFPYIRIFTFNRTPLEAIDTAVSWAESFIKKRASKK